MSTDLVLPPTARPRAFTYCLLAALALPRPGASEPLTDSAAPAATAPAATAAAPPSLTEPLEDVELGSSASVHESVATDVSPRGRAEEAALGPKVVLAVSGGVSLGAYQAGYLYYFTRHMAKRQERAKLAKGPQPYLAAVTGASAGSINATLAAAASCQSRADEPEASIFYRTWVPVGIAQLWDDGSSVTARSLFSRAPIEEAVGRFERYLRTGPWKEKCSVDIGVVLTRLGTRVVPLQTDQVQTWKVRRMTEKMVFRLESRGSALRFKHVPPPRASNDGSHQESESPSQFKNGLADLFLRPGLPRRDPVFEEIADTLRASSAFPLAFEPVEVTYHYGRDVGGRDQFIDGGVFENQPVRLAKRLTELGESLGAGAPVELVAVEPDILAWTPRENHRADRPAKNLIETVSQFAPSFVSAARGSELLALVEERPELRERAPDPGATVGGELGLSLRMSSRRAVVASDHLHNFLGFFDERFRRFDFYVGMLDARADARAAGVSSSAAEGGRAVARLVDAEIRSPAFSYFLRFQEVSGTFVTLPAKLPEIAPHCSRAQDRVTCAKELDELRRLLVASTTYKAWSMSEEHAAAATPERFEKWLGLLEDQRFDICPEGITSVTKGEPSLKRYPRGPVFRSSSPDRCVAAQDFQGWLRGHIDDAFARVSSSQDSIGDRFAVSVLASNAAGGMFGDSPPGRVASLGLHLNRGFDIDRSLSLGAGGWARHLRVGLGGRARALDFIGKERSARAALVATGTWVLPWWKSLELGLDAGPGYVWETGAERIDEPRLSTAVHATYVFAQVLQLKVDGQVWPAFDLSSTNTENFLNLGFAFGIRNCRTWWLC